MTALPGVGKYRWRICALVFFATTINYLDRQVMSLLKPFLEENGLFGNDPSHYETIYANIVVSFQLAFAAGMIFVGGIIDRIGLKLGYAASLLGWSLASIAHAFVGGPIGFMMARVGLGIPEAGNYPAAIKTTAIWFPRKERALANGIAISGTNIGALLAPLSVPLIAITMGWQWAFIITGVIGMSWLFFWQRMYDSPEKKLAEGKLGREEYAYIMSGKDEIVQAPDASPSFRWSKLLTYRKTWAYFLGKLISDPPWAFITFWLPAFLKAQYGLKGTDVGLPIALVYTMATVGSIFGGWLPKRFMEGGLDPSRSRKRAMFIYALFPLPVIMVQFLGGQSMWLAVIIIGIAASAHQAWSANIYTTVSDMFPARAAASVTGIGGLAGAMGGMLIAQVAGQVLDHYQGLGDIRIGYGIMFMLSATFYLIAWVVMHLLAPKFDQTALD
ncbi:MAG: MFS transporter [Chitinophagia bacterium]|jgi:MFS transporter, ACS family, hexuronate transporter|nr:MFS transporter [Chitinophagia bacterium]